MISRNRLIIVTLTIFLVSSLVLSNTSFGDVISPKKQIQLKISIDKVSCKQGLVKVINAGDERPACVKPSSVEKIVKYGWANPVYDKVIESIIPLSEPLGEVKKLAIVKDPGGAGRLETEPRTVSYNYVFEACSFGKNIRAPQVLVTSDSESKPVKLANQILGNSCQTSAAKIKAADPNSITATLTNKGLITEKITELENNLADLRKQLEEAKINLSQLKEQSSFPDFDSNVQKASDAIIELRKQINDVRGEYNTYLFALHVNPKKLSEFRKPLSFEGSTIEGVTIKKLDVYKQVDYTERPFVYNVVFEVCSLKQTIRVPQVLITSDIETRTVNLGDKVPSGTCLKSVGKVKASHLDKITFELGTSDKVSATILELQKNIDSQQKTIAKVKEDLSQLTRKAQKPDNYAEKVTELTNQLIDLRNKINSNKAQLTQIHFQFLE